jgi:serine/threonine protein kinase
MGINTHYTEKVDMWAAGIVLYMLLTGTYPFDENAQMVASDSQGQEVNPNDMEGLIDTIRNGEEWVNDLLMQDVCSHISEEAK